MTDPQQQLPSTRKKKAILSSTFKDENIDSVHNHDVANTRTKTIDEMLAEVFFQIKNWI